MFENLKAKLVELGYVVDDNMDFATLERLRKRVGSSLESEDATLLKFAKDQLDGLQDAEKEIQMSYATLIDNGRDDTIAENANITSADALLDIELSTSIREWVMQAVISNVRVTDDELFESFINNGKFSVEDTALKDAAIMRYISVLRPMYVQIHEREAEKYVRQVKSRKKLANAFVSSERKKASAIVNAKHRAVIRQLFEVEDGKFETNCPICGKRTALDGTAFTLMAYAAEKGQHRQFCCGDMVCSTEGCGTALLFAVEEYMTMLKIFNQRCGKSIDAFMVAAKKECTGASVMHVNVPVSAVSDCLEDIVVGESRPILERVDDAKSVVQVNINDDEMMEATRRFYFKLKGLISADGNDECQMFTESSSEAVPFDTKNEALGMQGGSATGKETGWTYHDVAVFVTQCLSKDYYVEKNKAIFSLVSAIKLNPYLDSSISMGSIWTLDVAIAFVERYQRVNSVKSLRKEELIELCSSLRMVQTDVPGTEVEILDSVKAALPALKELRQKLILRRDRVLGELEEFERELSYIKVARISASKLSDLEQIFADGKSVSLFNRVADRMIINTYAGEFYNYWSSLNVVRQSVMRGICDIKADRNSVRTSLQSLCKEYGLFSDTALNKMSIIYDRDAQMADALRKLHRYYVNADFYEFCKTAANVPYLDIPRTKVGIRIADMLKDFNRVVGDVMTKTKAQVYLTRDFSDDEIARCDKCSEILFRRWVLKREEGESIDEYCERTMSWDGTVSGNVKVHDNFELFNTIENFGTALSVCSNIYDAEYDSFSKSVFMSELLCDAYYNAQSFENVGRVLGLTKMQQNIIKTVSRDSVFFDSPDLDYKVVHGIYLSSINTTMDQAMERYDCLDLKVGMRGCEMRTAFRLSSELEHAYQVSQNIIDEDGNVTNDTLEVFDEIAGYVGTTVDEVLGSIGK